jgi:hypothetical protein
MNTPVQMSSEEPPQPSPEIQQAEHQGASSSSSGFQGASSSSGFHGARRSPNSNISAVGVNSNIEMAPHLQAPVQVHRHPVVEVQVEPPVVLFQRGFLPNWEDRMNLSNPGFLTIYPALTE